jgi:alpha-amylase/alpha-mannosidase (GH57 family)
MNEPLSIAFVWHMHQPYYRISRDGPYEMPWARLHALKDYAGMVQALDAFPDVHQTFNLVPSLVEQLEDYGRGEFADVYWQHTLKPADELSPTERAFVVDLMCPPSWNPLVQRFPRFLELSRKKEATLGQGVDACSTGFTGAELRDLQVWFNLAWFDPIYQEQEPLAALVAKGHDFSEDDKQTVAAAQGRILAATLPTYRQAAAAGRIELTTSPYFHPILPLLINSDSARIARGDIPLPSRRFAHPEDAAEQVERGLRAHERVFGARPRGMWCSEQAVGEEVIPLLADAGVEWTISDEGVLARSLRAEIQRSDGGHVLDPQLLYRPYRLEREGRALDIVFRDRILSDLLGFTYRSWAPRDAAANLIWRLREARTNLASSSEAHLVTIALDGENAWEYYARDGHDFLSHLYEGLSSDPGFCCVTVSEFLARHPPARELPWLHTGSWINADFSTWMGDPAHGAAWDLLHQARDFVAARRSPSSPAAARPGEAVVVATEDDADPTAVQQAFEEAWQHVLVAEGSDWFWWFGEHQESGVDYLWDLNFRRHLQEAYRALGESPPPELFGPILSTATETDSLDPSGPFTPVMDGMVSHPHEWSAAGVRRPARAGAMQRTEGLVLREVRFGTDQHDLFLLFAPGPGGFPPGTQLAVYFSSPADRPRAAGTESTTDRIRFYGRSRADAELGFELTHELSMRVQGPGLVTAMLARPSNGVWPDGEPLLEAALGEVLEVAVPLRELDILEPARLEFVVAVARDGVLLELIPARGAIDLDLSTDGVNGP